MIMSRGCTFVEREMVGVRLGILYVPYLYIFMEITRPLFGIGELIPGTKQIGSRKPCRTC